MRKWKAFVEGQVLNRCLSFTEREVVYDSQKHRRHRQYSHDDTIAKRKRIASRRAKKGYK